MKIIHEEQFISTHNPNPARNSQNPVRRFPKVQSFSPLNKPEKQNNRLSLHSVVQFSFVHVWNINTSERRIKPKWKKQKNTHGPKTGVTLVWSILKSSPCWGWGWGWQLHNTVTITVQKTPPGMKLPSDPWTRVILADFTQKTTKMGATHGPLCSDRTVLPLPRSTAPSRNTASSAFKQRVNGLVIRVVTVMGMGVCDYICG